MQPILLKPISPLTPWCMALTLGVIVGFLLFAVGPFLQSRLGLSPTYCLVAVAMPFFVFQIILSLILYAREGRPFEWKSMAERFRFRKIRGIHGVYVVVATAINIGSYTALTFTVDLITPNLPTWWTSPHGDSVASHSGDYLLFVIFFITVVLNVFGEELFWRGYVLPRQELQHGKNTWWIHGLQFWFFHMFRPWDIARLFPGMLVYGWLATRTQNILPGLIMHGCTNGLAVFFLFLEVAG